MIGHPGVLLSIDKLPDSAADWIGDSGGIYQTIGSVRYSGCSGKATFHSMAIFQTGDLRAAYSQASGIPSLRACSITLRRVGVQEHVELLLIKILFVGGCSGSGNPVGIVEDNPKVADPAYTGFGTDRGLSGFDSWITEDALL